MIAIPKSPNVSSPVFMLVISTAILLIGIMLITVQMLSAWLAGKVLIVLPFYTMPRTPPVFTQATGTMTPIQI